MRETSEAADGGEWDTGGDEQTSSDGEWGAGGDEQASAESGQDWAAWAPARVALAVQREHPEKLRDYYTAIGTRVHPGEQQPTDETIAAALAEVDLPAELIELGHTDANDDALKASHHEGMDPVGDEVGTPVIRINEMSLFGPVISPAPKGEQAGDLFDGFAKLTAYPGFFEAKRTRTVGPIFD